MSKLHEIQPDHRTALENNRADLVALEEQEANIEALISEKKETIAYLEDQVAKQEESDNGEN